MGTQDQINAAIGAHGMWKARLKPAIEKGTSEFSPATIQVDDRCDFGKWLHGAEKTAFKSSPHYTKRVQLHRQFHIVAAKVLSLALNGKRDEALHFLDLQGEFSLASATLTKAMVDWKSAA
jgi:hypothetical protein